MSRLSSPPAGLFLGVGYLTVRRRRYAHVGLYIAYIHPRTKALCYSERLHLGAFDGPTCAESAREAARMISHHCTLRSDTRCTADGPAPEAVQPWDVLREVEVITADIPQHLADHPSAATARSILQLLSTLAPAA